MFGAGCGILLYRFLIIAFLSTSDVVMLLRKEFIYIILCAEIGFKIIFFKVTVILKTSRQTKIILKVSFISNCYRVAQELMK